MKKDTRSISRISRVLRVESLESRQMLSATPWDAFTPVSAGAVEIAAQEVPVDVVDQSDSPELSFEATGVANQYLATWDAVADAASYEVRVAKDGGESKKITVVTDTSATLNGVYVGKTYDFRVWALDSAGARIGSPIDGSIVPASLSLPKSLAEGYKANSEVTVNLRSGDPDNVSLSWFYATDEGDVAIPDAQGLSYTPTEATYPIKVVATSADTLGSSAEVTISVYQNKMGDGFFSDYNTVNRSVDLTWNVVDGAAGYRFLKGTMNDDGTITWKKSATITVEDGAVTSDVGTLSADGTELTYTIRMFNTGSRGIFRVVATDDMGRTLETQNFTFTSFGVQINHEAYSLGGDTLDAALTPYTSDLYKAEYQWYSSADFGATWTAIDGATTRALTTTAADADAGLFFKVVVTHPKSDFAASAIARPAKLPALVDVDITTDSAGVLSVTFENTGYDYQIQYYNTDVDFPIWLNLPISDVDTESVPGYVTVTQTNGLKYYNYDIRVRHVSEDAYSPWNTFSSTEKFNVNERSVTLDWTDVHNASSYHVLIPSETDESGWKVYANDLAESTVTINGVGIGKSFPYRISAYGDSGLLAEIEGYYEAVEYKIENATFDPYVTLNRNINLTWDLVEDAASYRVYKDFGNTGTWKTAIKNIGVVEDGEGGYVISPDTASASVSLSGDRLTYTIGMFNAGVDASFKIVALSQQGYILAEEVVAYDSVGLELVDDVYNENMDTLVATVVTDDVVTYQWYSSVDGQTWTAIDGETGASLTVDADSMPQYKVVATNADGYESVAYAWPEGPSPVLDVDISVDDDNLLTFVFDEVAGATGYQVEYYYADAEYPVWLNMTQVTYTDNGDGTITATHVNGANYIDYTMRVRAFGDGTASIWNKVSPSPVTGVSVSASNVDSVKSLNFSWNASSDTDSYTVEQYDAVQQSWNVVAEGDDLSYSAEVAESGAYKFRVKANNEYASSEYAEVDVVVPSLTFSADPYMPGGSLTVTPEAEGLTVNGYQWYAYSNGVREELVGETSATLANAPVSDYLVVQVVFEDGAVVAIDSVDCLPAEEPSAVVTTESDVVNLYDGVVSLREAFAYVQNGLTSGSTITFANGVETVTLNSPIEVASGTVTVDGGSSATLTGGALFNVVSGGLTIENITIANTVDAFSASGSDARLTLRNVVFTGNVASSVAKGVVTATNGSRLIIDRLASSSNGNVNTGAIVYVDGASVQVANSLFANNVAYYAPSVALFNTSGDVVGLYNLTIADNVASCNDETYSGKGIDSKKGAALFLEEAAGVRVYNTLFYNNENLSLGAKFDFVAYGTGYGSNYASMDCFYYNGSYEVETPGSFRRTNLRSEPTFGEGYTLVQGSSAIDAGGALSAGSLDLAGNPRVSGSKVDLGAYEYQQNSSALIDEAFEDYFADDFDV